LVIIEMGYAANQTEDFRIAAVGFGLANGLCQTAPIPENCPAIVLASASIDSCCNQRT
jgi:hypothetical protein